MRHIVVGYIGKAIKVDHGPVLLDWRRQSQHLGFSQWPFIAVASLDFGGRDCR